MKELGERKKERAVLELKARQDKAEKEERADEHARELQKM